MQFYDTPKSVREALASMDANATDASNTAESRSESGGHTLVNQFAGPYGNYDIPSAPIPVFRKMCGCIMKLVPDLPPQNSQCNSADINAQGAQGKRSLRICLITRYPVHSSAKCLFIM